MFKFSQLNPRSYPRHVQQFLCIAYGFSFVLWIAAWALGQAWGVEIFVNNEIINSPSSQTLIISLLAAAATLGPAIGYLVVRKQADHASSNSYSLRGSLSMLRVFAALSLSMLVIGIGVNLASSQGLSNPLESGGMIAFALLYFALTSGTEEFGWRGVLYSHVIERTKDLWDSSVVMGVLWGLWHTPIVYIIFSQGGMSLGQMILPFFGFLASITFMSYLHGWLWIRYRNPILNYLLHTLHNWFPILAIAVYSEAPNAIASIGGYLLTILILETRFSSKDLAVKF